MIKQNCKNCTEGTWHIYIDSDDPYREVWTIECSFCGQEIK